MEAPTSQRVGYAVESPAPGGLGLPEDTRGVLAAARAETAAADRAEARKLELAVQWAVLHPAETLDDAESYASRVHSWCGEEQPVTLAGPGAPLVAEFCVAEFAASVGMGTEAGKYYLGQAIELRYRLPRLWARVQSGDLPAWKARRVAAETIGRGLSQEAADYVDRHVASVAHKIRPTGLGRLVDEAIARYMPDQAEQERVRAADARRFDIDTDQPSFAGTATVAGELDLADALDLEDAIQGIAGQLADLGSTEPLDARRAAAAGELARRQLALDLSAEQDAADEGQPNRSKPPARRRPPVRKTVLFLHLAADAVTCHDHAEAVGCRVGRVENTRAPVTAEQIRAWCGHPDTQLTVKPVTDLAGHVHVEQYEVADRIAETVALRDLSCVFPWVRREALVERAEVRDLRRRAHRSGPVKLRAA